MIKSFRTTMSLLFLYLIAIPVFAAPDEKRNNPEGKPVTLMLPVNALEKPGNRVQVIFNPPKDFRNLQELSHIKLLEFVPKNDDENNWSEIITVNLHVGVALKASQFIQLMKERFMSNPRAKDVKTLEESGTQHESYESAALALAYTTNARREVVRFKAFSGPADLTVLQYAIALKGDITEQTALEKEKGWLEDPQNVEINKF